MGVQPRAFKVSCDLRIPCESGKDDVHPTSALDHELLGTKLHDRRMPLNVARLCPASRTRILVVEDL